VRWENNVPFDFILSEMHFCQKLSKLVDVGRHYSKPKKWHFLRHHVVYIIFQIEKQQLYENSRYHCSEWCHI